MAGKNGGKYIGLRIRKNNCISKITKKKSLNNLNALYLFQTWQNNWLMYVVHRNRLLATGKNIEHSL